MITEDYVSYKTAKLLKEKGFNESTIFVYYDFLPSSLCFPNEMCRRGVLNLFYYDETTNVNNKFNNSMSIPKYISGEVYSAPTIQMAMKWLREVHKRIILVNFHRKNRFSYDVLLDGECGDNYILYTGLSEHFKNYEEACEAAIKYCLENLI